ncbi:hypothetical protein SELMODRAFT_415650 [Selaginella moellendorffii]|uniref:FHA domain-containing protein n=1 Tax=Selaginella moellendorffii TaxID=88036 RepID=D8RWT4_SELML|nr:uncharacterized protein LOC9630636 [Selaginella moellendorffii]XP_024536491.1 uncharacterized protein LOC9630636 [Selaginella moellendorffii]EFJ23310.1 hypothetical protein SELMODRAFT_415650 [Selaginella moellendorffii]|eukprot:XP_002975681.1 uncharacterized protein LOC9630636 [Selaginella moellendorffii]
MGDSRGRFVVRPLAAQSFLADLEVAPGKIYTVGRSSCCDLVFKDGRVSRRHCQIFVDAGNSLVLHHGVEKGADICLRSSVVYVNSERISLGSSRVLVPGDRVFLVAPVKDSIQDTGFTVENAGESSDAIRSSLEELEMNVQRRQVKSKADHLGPSLNCKVKRVKASVEKLIDKSRQLRSECFTRNSSLENRAFVGKERDLEEVEQIGGDTKVASCDSFPKSSGLCMNKLEDVQPSRTDVSVADLLAPLEDIREMFVASFTTDIIWFISSFGLPKTLPVTIACHDSERSWSTAISDRMEHPYCEWPNLKVVYPPFPVLRRTNDKSRMRGVGCHHPKFFLLKRSKDIRVIVTSSNLNYRQWLQVSNTVWWQDFPLRNTRDYSSLFSSKITDGGERNGDFAAYLAGFISTLVKDVPSEAHWATDLACYNFSKATVSLVASVPGLWEELLPFPESMKELEKSYLGTVATTVAGISHQFSPKCDPNGLRLRKLAALLNSLPLDPEGMVHVQLKRAKDLPADPNAVVISVVPPTQQLRFLEQSDIVSQAEELPIGFLPKRAAAWVSTLCDAGLCSLRAMLWPKQVLGVAAGQSKSVLQLKLHVFEGSKFGELLSKDQESAMSNLLRHIQRKYGLRRLKEVLAEHKWPDSAEVDFVYCSSSIGTSLSSNFLASFSDAAGRKASLDDSCESDPEWGRWTAEHEAANPSIKVVFPTLDRLKSAKWGPSSYRGILCFAERTWERIKSTSAVNLHDAIPCPPSREGIPMHVKVAQRRFKSPTSSQAFGWIYTGSHNFSPAAWGKYINKAARNDDEYQPPCTRLHICNYELGIIFIDPPPTYQDDGDSNTTKQQNHGGIHSFTLPFRVPAPKYSSLDRPATGSAIFQLVQQLGEGQRSVLNEAGEHEGVSLSDVEIDTQEPEEDDASSSACL